ncbi:MAG: M14 family metallopeptidase [Limisphaerales bacterium]
MRVFALLLVLVSGCLAGEVALQTRTNYLFKGDGIRISNRFPGARVNECERIGERKYRILIRPENTPINRSPWYAFKVRSRTKQTIQLTLRYHNAIHRYSPRVTEDQETWSVLPQNRIKVSPRRTEATLTLDIGPESLWVAGQERIGVSDLRAWSKDLKSDAGKRKKIGTSLGDRAIHGLQLGSLTSTNVVIIVSRQHPPEVTGTIGLMNFVERLMHDDEKATAFRQQVGVLLVPLMNPDGVKEGHWRHNLAGVDLNRDWRDFKQPETRAVRDWIERTLKERGARPLLFLDFHSTYRDVFYTQGDEHPTTPPDFTKQWLKAIGDRLPDYKVNRSAGHNLAKPTSKAWAYERFRCPAITYEFGDQTDRGLIGRQTSVAAEEMMRLLREYLNP